MIAVVAIQISRFLIRFLILQSREKGSNEKPEIQKEIKDMANVLMVNLKENIFKFILVINFGKNN